MGAPEGEERANGTKKFFEKIIAKVLPNLRKRQDPRNSRSSTNFK